MKREWNEEPKVTVNKAGEKTKREKERWRERRKTEESKLVGFKMSRDSAFGHL